MIRARVHRTTIHLTAGGQPLHTQLTAWGYEIYDTTGPTLIARNVATHSYALTEACRHLNCLNAKTHCEPTRPVNESQ